MKKILSIFAAMFAVLALNAAVINIDNTTADALRLALNDANDGDEIVMAAGTYVESNGNYIAFDGKAVTVKAAEGANVIIQPQVPITVSNGGHAIFENVKIDASHLTDLADWYEHVLYVTDGNPNGFTFRGCELYGFNINKSMFFCSASNKVAAIKFENCYFHDIQKSIIFIENTDGKPMVSVKNCTFENIIASVTDSYWAGIIDVRAAEATLKVDKCTFYNVVPMNTDYSAVSKITLAKGTVSNCIFMLPTPQDGIRAMRGVTATNCITFNYLKDSGTGIHSSVTQNNCVQVDPAFVDPDNGNFTLGEGSPALTMNDGEPIGDPRWVPAPAPAEPQVLYLKPGSAWYYVGNNEKFAIYAWADGKEAVWSDFMELAEKETDIWTGTIPAGYDNVIFVRFGNAATTPSWEDNMWNQTEDLKIEEGKDLYTITKQEPYDEEHHISYKAEGEWSKYEYIAPAKFYIVGDKALVGEEKAWAPDAIKVTEDSYTFENLAAGNYQFKITIDGTWSTAKGFEDLTPASRAAELYLNGGNIGFTLAAAGDVTITFIKDEVFKAEGAFVLPQLQLIGFNGWDGSTDAIDFVPAEDHLTASVAVTLEERKDYEFKLIYAASWIGKKTGDDPENKYILKNDWTSVDGLTWDGYNIVLRVVDADVVPGDYVFAWTYATGALTVTFPSPGASLDNTNVESKIEKFFRDGQLIIRKNGVEYNAQGAIVK